MNDALLKALHYLLLISEVEEVEIFKICLEYWNSLASDLYRESPYASGTSPLFMSRPTGGPPGMGPGGVGPGAAEGYGLPGQGQIGHSHQAGGAGPQRYGQGQHVP